LAGAFFVTFLLAGFFLAGFFARALTLPFFLAVGFFFFFGFALVFAGISVNRVSVCIGTLYSLLLYMYSLVDH